jgi:siderophore synthetase component
MVTSSSDPVERRLIEQFFNTYCRETGIHDPCGRAHLPADLPIPAAFDAILLAWQASGQRTAVVALPCPDGHHRWLAAALDYVSPVGYHQLACAALLGPQDHQPTPLRNAEPMIEAIVDALAANFPESAADDWPARFAALMRNGVEKARLYHDKAPPPAPSTFIAAEQRLRFGHVFHGTSKASEGFSHDDLHRYAPELGAAFPLHYLAVANEYFEAHTTDGHPLPIDPEVIAFAAPLLRDGEYRLLPCHPWQARHLLQQPAIRAMVASGALLSLGQRGELAWPTSSVRTVWLPRQRLFLKLAIDVRITNFVRNNPPEHVHRALDASRAIAQVPVAARATERFTVLTELGGAMLAVDDAALRASTAVIYRQGLPTRHGDAAQVLATVLEDPPHGTSLLASHLRQALGASPAKEDVSRWWACYLEVTLLPLARLFGDYGISLEAHLQNSMVAFHEGWPVHGYVRDMEGVSIGRDRYPQTEAFSGSPAFYEEAAALHRFAYYVMVNHIGHCIACMARAGYGSEAALWCQTARAMHDDGPTSREVLARLAAMPTLPAKANLLSCFGRHGETPAWVAIANPLHSCA